MRLFPLRKTKVLEVWQEYSRSEIRRGDEKDRLLLFDRFIVDKTHCILVFDDSFDELSLSQSLCKEKREHKKVNEI